MELLVIVVLLSSVYCSDSNGPDRTESNERQIAGGGNYGGFIGLTTYGAGPFLVKGKYEIDDQDNNQGVTQGLRGDIKTNEQNDRAEYKPFRYTKKDSDEYVEYLGYRGPPGLIDYCFGGNKDDGYINTLWNRNINSTNAFDEEIRNRCDKIFGFTGPTANDEPENLSRPCALDDWQCIRKYFASNSNCKPAYGPIPDPLYLNVNTLFLPIVNVTIALPNLITRGLSSAKIRDFYVNQRTGNLVFALDVTNLNQTVPRAYIRYRRTAKESIVLADYGSIVFRAITFTAVIPNIPHLRLDLADIHADVQDGTPPFIIGPGAANNTDPDVISAFAQLIATLPLATRENLLFSSQLLTSIYIQENICDFGLKLVSI